MLTRKDLNLLTIGLILLTQTLLAQIVLEGVIKDNGAEFLGNGADPVVGATVTITDQTDTTSTFSAMTGTLGHYEIQITDTGVEEGPDAPSKFMLFQNYPNPFNPSTVIAFRLARQENVRLSVYNVLGQSVRVLLDESCPAGLNRIIWDATDDRGLGVSAGVYIYTLKTAEHIAERRMLLLDGHTGQADSPIPSASAGSVYKTASNVYTLQITGPDNAPYEETDLTITANTQKNFSVQRTVTDIDGNVYPAVKIGDQWWTQENLKVTRYRNGEAIPNVTDYGEWKDLSTGARCAYDNNETTAETYGYLYNWHTVNDSRNIAPPGWHVPRDEEWDTLLEYLGGSSDSGGKLKEAGTSHWNSPNTGATNESGFTALPGGVRSSNNDFEFLSFYTGFWSATEDDSSKASHISLDCDYSDFFFFNRWKDYGYSVRLVRGEPVLSHIQIDPRDTTLQSRMICSFTCTAVYSNQHPADITNSVTWSVFPGTAGSIDANGHFTAHSTNTGTEAITALYQDETDQVTVIVDSSHIEYGTMTGNDGKEYLTVKIGEQWWMAENLRETQYRDGSSIPNVTGYYEWTDLFTGARCAYANNETTAETYGYLYNWHSVNDNRNIAPPGWHAPTDEDWDNLIDHLGGSSVAGGKLRETSTKHWGSPNTGASNESGFTALPGGNRLSDTGSFWYLDNFAYFWSATEYNSDTVWGRRLYGSGPGIERSNYYKTSGFSVRLLRSETVLSHIQIEPQDTTLQSGMTCPFTCTAVYSNQHTVDITHSVTWSVSPGTTGSIDANGLFTAHAANTGTETITAIYQGETAHASVIVEGIEYGTMTGNDGKVYQTVKIGDQWWMAENLRETQYRDGSPIPHVTDDSEWGGLSTDAWCAYANNETTAETYGYLYNWHTVYDSRNIAPPGWHVSTDEEWDTLVEYLGGSSVAGGKLKEAGTSHWNSPNTEATNESGFTALPGGYRLSGNGNFDTMGYYAYYWSATEYNSIYAWSRILNYDDSAISRINYHKQDGYSVRLVRD